MKSTKKDGNVYTKYSVQCDSLWFVETNGNAMQSCPVSQQEDGNLSHEFCLLPTQHKDSFLIQGRTENITHTSKNTLPQEEKWE